ncbi:class I adenylate-forming enzyme family protein [Streptomyces sp. NPDC101455]|uniref:class I adenylate-forming enzyme family protein n=1 Tax=Streptomyces sp. NPDC101455 TaxID=3366142 RepID=UPI003821E644
MNLRPNGAADGEDLPGPPAMNGPGDIIPAATRSFASKTALITDTASFTYAELDELTARGAQGLRDRGIRPGQIVSLYGPNSWQWVVAYHAALRAGAVVNPINTMLTEEEVAFILKDCHAAALLTRADRLPAMRAMAAELPDVSLLLGLDSGADDGFEALLANGKSVEQKPVDPLTLSTIGYTSGTTGHPKGAMQSQQAVLLNCQLTAMMHGRNSGDTMVTALPAPHVYGNVAINSTFLSGGTVVLMERFSPGAALDLVEKHQATLFEGVPAMYSMMLAHDRLASTDLTSLTRSTVGGQTIALSTIERWQGASGAPLIELWGMTELSGLGTTHALGAAPCPGSIGVALPGTEVRVGDLNDSSRTAPAGTPGELLVRGPLVMLGYHGQDQATAETVDKDGWLHTGDIAYSDESGHFFIVDRRKDMIITAGYNVYPAEIERVLAAHPDVAMVAVGPVPDEVKGETARAYVVPTAEATATAEQLIEYCRTRLAPYKVPRSVQFSASLPQTSTGKIMRRRLAETNTDHPSQGEN